MKTIFPEPPTAFLNWCYLIWDHDFVCVSVCACVRVSVCSRSSAIVYQNVQFCVSTLLFSFFGIARLELFLFCDGISAPYIIIIIINIIIYACHQNCKDRQDMLTQLLSSPKELKMSSAQSKCWRKRLCLQKGKRSCSTKPLTWTKAYICTFLLDRPGRVCICSSRSQFRMEVFETLISTQC